jgi:alkaline phosphatase D
MVWLGDNVYLREADWNTWSGIIHRYTHDWALPGLQQLLGTAHHYAIWDDHDFGPNNSDRSVWNKDMTLEAFELFWANPSFGVGELEGITTFFQWGDLDFFLLDNRYYRTPNLREENGKTQLGSEQLQWLMDGLLNSFASFKIVAMGGQFLNTDAASETYSNYGFDEERQKIIDFIHENDIKNVVFLTGDRHYTELSRLQSEGEPVIYDLTVSPLTAGVYTDADKVKNTLRVDGTMLAARNFAIIDVTGTRKERQLKISVYDSFGELKWDHTILKQ